jgi:hypothetical protein
MESIADNQKFKFLLTKCVMIKESGIPMFSDVDDYESKQNTTFAIDAATALAGQIYGYDKQMEINLVENKWLNKFNFSDNQGRLVDEDGRLINVNGDLVNEDGRFVDDQGNLVDNQGRPVDENGDFVVSEIKPFTDDDGKAIVTNTKKKQCVKRKGKAKVK